jgi:ABC-type antimicrobial peptide transport system permease subunit
LFVSTRQQADPGADVSLVIRSRLPAASAIPLIRGAVMAVEPAASVRTRVLEETIDATLVVERLLTRLSMFFGGLALLLAGVGLYGVIAYDAAQRRRDIGIRLALGSSRRRVVVKVVGQICWLLGAGLLAGVAVSVPLGRWIEGLVYGVTVRDVVTYVVAAIALSAVGIGAAWLPAWRAARMNPTSALRST